MKSILLLARPRAARWSLVAVVVLLLAIAAAAEKAAPPDPDAPAATNGTTVSSQHHEEGSAAAAAPAAAATQATHHEAGATVSAKAVAPDVPVSSSTNGPVATSGEAHSSPAPREEVVKVFALKYAEAAGAAETIEALYGAGREPSLTVAVDGRTNALIVRGSAEALEVIEALIKRLDAEQPATGNAARKAADLRAGMDARPATGDPMAMANPATASRLQQYRDLDRQASRIAADMRKSHQGAPGAPFANAPNPLRQAVEAAFEARQQLQRAQVAELRQRLARIEENIGARQRSKDAIVDHRMKELLDPNLQWQQEGDPLPGPGTPAGVTHAPGGPAGNWPALAPSPDANDPLRRRPEPTVAHEPAAEPSGIGSPGVSEDVRLLDSPRAFQKELAAAIAELRENEEQVRTVLAELRKRNPDATDDDIRESPSLNAREAAKKRVDFLRKEYATQVRLLELDLARAEQELAAANEALVRAKQLTDRGLVPQSDVIEKETATRGAQIRLEQLNTILKLYATIPDAQPEPPKSEVKPEPKKPAATTPEPPKSEAPKVDLPKLELPKPEATAPGTAKPETTTREASSAPAGR
ncbi:MAG: secretin N-terminal domain-containing protein [Pirellulales bacterium]